MGKFIILLAIIFENSCQQPATKITSADIQGEWVLKECKPEQIINSITIDKPLAKYNALFTEIFIKNSLSSKFHFYNSFLTMNSDTTKIKYLLKIDSTILFNQNRQLLKLNIIKLTKDSLVLRTGENIVQTDSTLSTWDKIMITFTK